MDLDTMIELLEALRDAHGGSVYVENAKGAEAQAEWNDVDGVVVIR